MAGARWLRLLIAALFALTLLGCSDDGGDDADVDTGEQTDDSADESSDDTSDLGDAADVLGDEDCRALSSVGLAMAAAFAPGQSGELAEAQAFFEDADVPDEIADEVAVLADFFRKVGEAFEDAGVDLSDASAASDPEAIAAYAQVFQELEGEYDQAELEAASQSLEAWAEENCDFVESGEAIN